MPLFLAIDNFAGTVNGKLAELEGKESLTQADLKDFVKYSETGKGITAKTYKHLEVQS